MKEKLGSRFGLLGMRFILTMWNFFRDPGSIKECSDLLYRQHLHGEKKGEEKRNDESGHFR